MAEGLEGLEIADGTSDDDLDARSKLE